jgi:DNA-binding NtrC family response regulator
VPKPPVDATYQHPALAPVSVPVRGRASLVIEAGASISAVSLHEGQSLSVGRAEPADVVIDDRSLSRLHARFTLRGASVEVEDLGSTNKLKLAGQVVTRATLEEGDDIELGGVRVTVSGLRGGAARGPLSTSARFAEACAQELLRARTFGRTFGLVACRNADGASPFTWPDGVLRDVDAATLYTPDLVLVLVPETTPDLALELARHLIPRVGLPVACAVAAFPQDGGDLDTLIERVVHTSRVTKPGSAQRVVVEQAPRTDEGPVVKNEAMQRLYGLVDRIARATLPVLVLGETGAGKELVAHAVHEQSARKKGPFVAINCASIPHSLIESMLFGHERGAFTGATERKLGVFEQASGGTVFLDEVGELSAQVQASLLRVLEVKRIARVGSTKEIDVDVRVVAATHRHLAAMVAAGTFREDLMFRLDALTLRVPPLRERVDEIEPLCERFLARAKAEWGVSPTRFSADALRALRAYRWPGNVRQLKNVVERAAVIASGMVIGLDELPEELLASPLDDETPNAARPSPGPRTPLTEHDVDRSFAERVSSFETRLIRDALDKTSGNQTRAAELLKIPRRTLTNKIHTLGIK